jgi:hypothetical protein
MPDSQPHRLSHHSSTPNHANVAKDLQHTRSRIGFFPQFKVPTGTPLIYYCQPFPAIDRAGVTLIVIVQRTTLSSWRERSSRSSLRSLFFPIPTLPHPPPSNQLFSLTASSKLYPHRPFPECVSSFFLSFLA